MNELLDHKNTLLSSALRCLDRGLSVIPVSGKTPLVNWTEFQNRKPTKEEIIKWFSELNPTGIGIITGKISGIVVVDVDLGGSTEGLSETATVKSGGGGKHFYYKYPGIPVKTTSGQIGPKIDIRGDGGFIVAPLSRHPNGNFYVVEKGFDKIGIAELPQWILEKSKDTNSNSYSEIVLGVEEGRRNTSATTLIGKLLNHLPKKDWTDFAWPVVQGWNLRNKPPLGIEELKNTFTSIAKSEIAKRNSKITLDLVSAADLLAKDIQEPEWVVKDLIPLNGITALSASPGQGKTWLALEIAKAVAKGQSLFDIFPVKQGSVLIVDEEDHENMIALRVRLLKTNKEDPIYWLIQNQFKLNNKNHFETIKRIAENNNVSLIIFDSLVRIHSAQENDAREMAGAFAYLRELTGDGRSILFTHHHRKERVFDPNQLGNSMRGSTDILAVVDAHIAIQMKPTDEEHIKDISVYVSKQRQAEAINPFKLKMISADDQVIFEYAGKEDIQKTKIERAKLVIIEVLDRELSTQEVVDAIKDIDGSIGKPAVSKALKSLEVEKLIKERTGPSNKKFYSKIPESETANVSF
ncbi:MAG: AAA family ATPase [Candidatus Yanofskybacteria bacterium]|nr:AAA family ATPase [Candidatus Yanofskybacteria bacterium]